MKTNTKIGIGLVAVALFAAAILSSNTKFFRGALVPGAEPGVPVPTALNFSWVAPVSTVLTTGRQVEVARFTLGASPNTVMPGAFLSIRELRLDSLGSAHLTNFALHDVTYNMNIADGANSSSFNTTAAGGQLGSITLAQGETRTFKILADVRTTGSKQTAQFAFNKVGNILWSVTDGIRRSACDPEFESCPAVPLYPYQQWARVTGDTLSKQLVAAATPTDVISPRIE